MARYVCIGGPADGEWHEVPVTQVEAGKWVDIRRHPAPTLEGVGLVEMPPPVRIKCAYLPVPFMMNPTDQTRYVLVAFDPNLHKSRYPYRALAALISNYRPRKEIKR